MRNISSDSLVKAMVFEISQSCIKSIEKSELNDSVPNFNESIIITANCNSSGKDDSPKSKNTEVITED